MLVRSDPRDIPRIIKLSRATNRTTVQKSVAEAGYNILAIPLAAGASARRVVVLGPVVGALLMPLSTIRVASNAQTFRRVGLRQIQRDVRLGKT